MDQQRNARAQAIAAEPLRLAGPRNGFFEGTMESIRDIWSRRELLDLLVRREITARYKDSILGFFWSLARPLTMLLVYYFAIGVFLGAARNTPDFAIFIFTGLTAWQLFSDIVIIGTGSIVGNAGLIKKVYVPRELFPLSVVGSALFNFAIQLSVLLAATALLGRFPTGERWVFFVLALAVLVADRRGCRLGAADTALDVHIPARLPETARRSSRRAARSFSRNWVALMKYDAYAASATSICWRASPIPANSATR